MSTSWVGRPDLVDQALARAGADEDATGNYVIAGLKAESLFDHGDDLHIGPETLYFVEGSPLRVIDLLQPNDAVKEAVGQ